MPEASVIIVTRNRRELAAITIESALALQGDIEILVIDDASADGSADYLRQRFPQIRVHRSEQQLGYIVHRNAAARMASSPVVVSIDDDAVFTSPQTIQIALALFADERVGVVSLAFVNHLKDGRRTIVQAVAPDDRPGWVTNTFVGTAYAVRRDVFLALGGFREAFRHWGEELEYCQRLFNAGYVVAVAKNEPIVHSPTGIGRDYSVNKFITRNGLLTIWMNAPARLVLPMSAALIVRNVGQSLRDPRDAWRKVCGSVAGIAGFWTFRRARRPISYRVYKLWLDIRKRRPVRLEEIAEQLPQRMTVTAAPAMSGPSTV